MCLVVVLATLSALANFHLAHQQANSAGCSQVLPHIRTLEARYLNTIDEQEFRVRQIWKLASPTDNRDEVASAQPPTNDFQICLRLRQKRLLIRWHSGRPDGQERIILVNESYSARVLRLAGGGYYLERHAGPPSWERWCPDFHSIGIHGLRAADPVLALLSPVVALGPPIAALLAGEHGFTSRCGLTSKGLLRLRASSTTQYQPWLVRTDRQWEVTLDPNQQFACTKSRVTSRWDSFAGEVTAQTTYTNTPSLLPSQYVVEELARSVAGKSPSVVHHLLIEYTIGPPTPCQHPPEAFYLPYYGIDESVITPSGTLRVAVLAAASAAAALLALLALLALRRAWNRPNSSV